MPCVILNIAVRSMGSRSCTGIGSIGIVVDYNRTTAAIIIIMGTIISIIAGNKRESN